MSSAGAVAFADLTGTATDAQIPNNITIDLAAAATALAADGANCTGNLPRGVDASGAAQGCADADLTTEVTGVLPVPNGGSGAATLTGVVKGNGAAAFTVVAGAGGDCVKVDGTSGACGGGSGLTLFAPTSGSGSAYAGAGSPVPGSYTDLAVNFKPDVTNTVTGPTVNISTLGAKTIVHQDGSSLAVGELVLGKRYVLLYDGVSMQMIDEKLAAGASGAIVVDRSTNPGTVDIVTAVVPQKAAANDWTGANDFSGAASIRPFRHGTAAPTSGDCDASGEVGRTYLQTGDPATVVGQVWACRQTGASSYAWHPISHIAATAAPATCTTGMVHFDTDAAAGSNWFGCTATNTWTLMSGGGAANPSVKGAGLSSASSSTSFVNVAAISIPALTAGERLGVRIVARKTGTADFFRVRLLSGATVIWDYKDTNTGVVDRHFLDSDIRVYTSALIVFSGRYLRKNGTEGALNWETSGESTEELTSINLTTSSTLNIEIRVNNAADTIQVGYDVVRYAIP
jgi:hypothetical protein